MHSCAYPAKYRHFSSAPQLTPVVDLVSNIMGAYPVLIIVLMEYSFHFRGGNYPKKLQTFTFIFTPNSSLIPKPSVGCIHCVLY